MKKKAFAILTLCISLFAAVALVGCGCLLYTSDAADEL